MSQLRSLKSGKAVGFDRIGLCAAMYAFVGLCQELCTVMWGFVALFIYKLVCGSIRIVSAGGNQMSPVVPVFGDV